MLLPFFRRKKRKSMQKNLLDRVSVKYNRTELSNSNSNENENENRNVMMNENRDGNEIGNNYFTYNNNYDNNNNNDDNQINAKKSINNYWNSKSDYNRSNFNELLPETQEIDKYLGGENETEVEVEDYVKRGEEREGGGGGGKVRREGEAREERGGRDGRQGSTARYSNQ
jgi:hypothetical protein